MSPGGGVDPTPLAQSSLKRETWWDHLTRPKSLKSHITLFYLKQLGFYAPGPEYDVGGHAANAVGGAPQREEIRRRHTPSGGQGGGEGSVQPPPGGRAAGGSTAAFRVSEEEDSARGGQHTAQHTAQREVGGQQPSAQQVRGSSRPPSPVQEGGPPLLPKQCYGLGDRLSARREAPGRKI